MFWQRLMKSCVKDGYLWQTRAEYFTSRRYALDVGRIVQGREVNAVFDAAQDFVVDYNRVREALTAMNYAMPYSVNIRNTFYVIDF